MEELDKYEVVVGLEVHAQLLTRSKLFSGDSAAFSTEPNSQVSPISLAHPGTLPKMNREAISFAVKMGIACDSEIVRQNYFARKNYFYPDLPKGYQISQHTTPICVGGFVKIKTEDGEKHIRLNRIHLEEDAGKSLHDIDADYTSVDFNRAGVPLIEIVSEPDLNSGEEAYAFLTELRKLVRYLGICDGNMEEGSLRCDANVSIRLKGVKALGTKVEVKNLNSIRNVKRAIDFEANRMMALVADNEPIIQQTRGFDADSGTTFAMREKEEADDYRYFADPDLAPFVLESRFIEEIRSSIPVLQEQRVAKYTSEFSLSEYDARVLTEDRLFADYFEELVSKLHSTANEPDAGRIKAAANWMLGPVKSWMNENNSEITVFPLQPSRIAAIIKMIEQEKVSFSIASTRLWQALLNEPSGEPVEIAEKHGLVLQADASAIESMIDNVLGKFPDKVAEFQKGKKGLLGLFVGEVMKLSGGKADPKITNEILLSKLKSK